MTNGWIDIKNTDMMLIMGGNPAENHPCGFKSVSYTHLTLPTILRV